MWWERGTLLKKFNNISYTYDGQCKLVKRDDGTTVRKLFYDGDKLIAEKTGDIVIRYFYDFDGVAGFKIGQKAKYHYVKDAQNVIALSQDSGSGTKIIAYYTYDAFGKASVVDSDGNEITAWNNAAVLNPFRWKSQYIDSDTGLYYISKRWYDPECGRFINAASPECLLSNAATVFALNLYAFAIENPVAIMLACGSIYPSLDFYFDGTLGIWERYWRQIVLAIGIVATIAAVAFTVATCGAGGGTVGAGVILVKIALDTVSGAAITIAIGGYVSGIKSMLAGNNFWEGLGEYLGSVNYADVLLTSFAFAAVTAAISSAIAFSQCFKEGTLIATEDGLKPIEEIEVGDKVLAYDEVTGEQAYKEVVRLFRNKTDEWYHVTANGEELVCTGGHPFFVKDKGFVSAKNLSVDDILRLSNGALIPVSAISVEKLENPETTYNFEVADFHTYYVGESEVLVHNTCGANSATPEQDLYRGGNDMTLKPNEYKIKDGLVVPGKDGVSVNLNASEVAKFGQPYKVVSVPKGLTIAQKGLNPAHYVIRPAYAMTLLEYQSLLYEVVLIPV